MQMGIIKRIEMDRRGMPYGGPPPAYGRGPPMDRCGPGLTTLTSPMLAFSVGIPWEAEAQVERLLNMRRSCMLTRTCVVTRCFWVRLAVSVSIRCAQVGAEGMSMWVRW